MSSFAFEPHSLFKEEQPHPSLCKLMDILEIAYLPNREALVEISQTQWLQKGKERWEFEERYPQKREQLLPLLQSLGCVENVLPLYQHYDYVLILGGLEQRMKDRVSFFLNLVQNGLTCSKVFLLGGERPLQSHLEAHSEEISTESELLLYLWSEFSTDSPINIPFAFVSTPMKQTPSGTQRPNTQDTFISWKALGLSPGSCLVISSQPFVGYQHYTALGSIPSYFHIETVGPSSKPDTPLSVYLDNLAKWIYQENVYTKGKK